MPTAIVLGAGMVGSVMAADLAADPEFTVAIADSRQPALDAAAARAAARPGARKSAAPPLATVRADLSDPARIKQLVAPYDLVLGALASHIAFGALRAVVEAGKPYADISFMPEDALELDDLARRRGVVAVVDCGVAPGMSNMIAGHEHARLDEPEALEIYVGGLPVERRWPFQYKAAFSPADVIEEYTRPVRLVERGRVVVKDALTEIEPLDVPGLGTLEAANTDGLRSLARTLRFASMKEKTLRYPGHYELMRILSHTGLFGTDPITITPRAGGEPVSIAPRDLLAALMFPRWTYQPGEEDLTVMRITTTGRRAGQRARTTWDLLDRYDRAAGATSMARTTAFPCTAVARLIAAGRWTRAGVSPPETLGQTPGILESVLEFQAARGVRYTRRDETLG